MQRSSDLRRTAALAQLIDDQRRYLIVCGLGTAAFDAARLSADGTNLFPIDGAMGCAVGVGLGLALAQSGRQVLVMTGDGELLMGLGSLATAAVQSPPNLSILCIDNGVWGLTGAQPTHTSFGADLTAIAAGCGVPTTLTVSSQGEIPQGRALLEDDTRLTFVRLELGQEPAEPYPFDRDGPTARRRFRDALSAST